MFVAWRDLRSATGRFALIGAVVALITLLVGFLSGLTAGLAVQNVSAITALPGDRVVFSMPGGAAATYADSIVTSIEAESWRGREGVQTVAPLGITQAKLVSGSGRAGVALFGGGAALSASAPSRDGTVVVSAGTATDLGVRPGDAVTVVGERFTVARVVPDTWYSHTAVTWMTVDDWRRVSLATSGAATYGTVLVVQGVTDDAAADAAAGTTSDSVLLSLTALSAFRSEIGSLGLIVGMLFVVSALVVGSFFAVWSVQRKPDFAVLKALGASARTLHVDALGQAATLLVVGVGVGIGLTVLLGGLASSALPFVLSPLTTVLPGAAMIAFGLVGASIATRSVTRVDPLTALEAAR